MKLFYFLLKIACYAGLGVVLHLANIQLTQWHFWAVIFLAVIIDLFSGWLILEQFVKFTEH